MLAALRRRDFAAAARWGELGRGRLVGLLALIARAGTGGSSGVPARVFWLRWALAPARRATLPLVRAVMSRRSASPLQATPVGPVSVHARHVALIAAAARNQPVSTRDVAALAAAWRTGLDERAMARLQARALELDVRNGAEQARALRGRVLDELAALLSVSHGDAIATASNDDFEAELASRVRQRQLDDVRDALRPLDPTRRRNRWRRGSGGSLCARSSSASISTPAARRRPRSGTATCATRCGAGAARCSTSTGRARAGWRSRSSTGSPTGPNTSATWSPCWPTAKTRAPPRQSRADPPQFFDAVAAPGARNRREFHRRGLAPILL